MVGFLTIAFFLQIFLQIAGVLTGNYNFANLLVVAILLSILDDQFFYARKRISTRSGFLGRVLNILLYAVILFGTIHLFNLKLNGSIVESSVGKFLVRLVS